MRSYFLHGMFYSIFSLLFGMGLALQLANAEQPSPTRDRAVYSSIPRPVAQPR